MKIEQLDYENAICSVVLRASRKAGVLEIVIKLEELEPAIDQKPFPYIDFEKLAYVDFMTNKRGLNKND